MKRPFDLTAGELTALTVEAMRATATEGLHIAFAAREVVLRKFAGRSADEHERLVVLVIEGAKMFVENVPLDVRDAIGHTYPQKAGFVAKASDAYESSREASSSGFQVYSVVG